MQPGTGSRPSTTDRVGRNVAVLLATALLALACSADPPVVPSTSSATATTAPSATSTPPTPEPTATMVPTPEPTEAPAPTVVATSEPMATAVPSATPEPTATAVPTPVPVSIDASVEASRLETTACPPTIDTSLISCLRATLPLRHESPNDGDTVEVLIALVDNGNPEDIGPVMYLQGGPGVATITAANAFRGVGHDVILVDQRGTGASEPKLACPEVDELWPSLQAGSSAGEDFVVDDEAVFEAYQSCADRLRAEGVALDAFHTDAVAADAAVIRQLLGLDEWSIWGVSYGTRVAQVIMRDHPAGLRAVVLDSVVPYGADFFASIPGNANRAIDALDDACAATECVVDHGDFGDTLAALVRRLDDEPVVVQTARAVTGESLAVEVDGARLLELVFTQLYSTRLLRSLPRQVARADFGGLEEIVAGHVLRRDPNRLDLASGVYYSTWCREEFPAHDPAGDDATVERGTERYGSAFEAALGSSSISRLCEAFDVPPAPLASLAPTDAAIPTLVLAGAFDPITPPAWSRSVADQLPQSVYVELPDHGHGAATVCPASLRQAFLASPGTELDQQCVKDLDGPDFE